MKAFNVLFSLIVLSIPLSASLVTIDPDEFADGTDISTAWSSVTLSSAGGGSNLDGKVYAKSSSVTSTGGMVFANSRKSSKLWLNTDTSGYYLRADFTIPVNYVSIDIIGDSTSTSDNSCVLVYLTNGSVETYHDYCLLGYNQVYHFKVEHDTPDIAYITVGGLGTTSNNAAILDNLQFEIPEPMTCLLLLPGLLLIKSKQN